MAKLLSSLPIGSKVKDVGSRYYGKDIIFTKIANGHTGYPTGSTTLITENIITSKAPDAAEPSNINEVRRSRGNGRYLASNIRQWLNSDKSNWFVAQHSADTRPNAVGVAGGYNPYDTEPGFLTYLTSNLKSRILTTTIEVALNAIDGGGKESMTNLIFLLSQAEVGLGGTDGTPMGYFNTATKRLCSPTAEAVSNNGFKSPDIAVNKPMNWWLRTPHPLEAHPGHVHSVHTDGSLYEAFAHNSITGIRPALNIPSSTLVSDTTDSDGAYTIIYNVPPTPPVSITIPTTVKGGESLSISWGLSTDADGNLTGYILERSVNGGVFTQIYKGANRSFTDTITKGWNTVAYRVKAYDASNAESGYTTSATRTVINNTPPIIAGTDQNLGDKNLGFLVTYQVNDADTFDSLIVTEKLNGSTIRTINGAPRNQQLEIEITNATLFTLPLNSSNTIEIKVDDQQGGVAYRRYTFRRTNSAPTISGKDEDLGQKTEPFSIDFSVSDNEGNAITVKTYLNNILKEEYQAEDGITNTFTISREDWYKLPIGQHPIKIEAIDEHGATAVRNYTFTRHDDKIQFTLRNPIENDIMATKILVTPTWTIPEGSIAKVEACNNAFDEMPTWEDITSQVLISRHYNCTNDIKTAKKWGINIRFTIEKGTATEECIINGFGGAFE